MFCRRGVAQQPVHRYRRVRSVTNNLHCFLKRWKRRMSGPVEAEVKHLANTFETRICSVMATCKMQETTQESTFSKDRSRIARDGVPCTRLVSPPVIQAGKHSICNCCACSGRKQRDGKHCSFTGHKYRQTINLLLPSQARKMLTIPMHDERDIGSKRVLSLLSLPTNGASADGDVSRIITKTGGHL